MNYKNHTQEELEANFSAADAVYTADADRAKCWIAAYTAYTAAAAYAYATYATAAAYADNAEYWIAKYFRVTGEDKALYEAEIKRINEANNE